MIEISGYQIFTKIYESANSLVYRALREEDNQPVVLKVLKEDYPSPTEINKYRLEYEITRGLDLEGAIKAYGLVRSRTCLVMVLEDFGGRSLREWLDVTELSLQEILHIAICLAQTLGELHGANIVHKDINPSNILYNPDTNVVKIVDFGISTHLDCENPSLKNLSAIEGTLAYMSPEQTGRMNRTLDYRTDFYSLGVTLYELLTRRLPFETKDAMELVHCHIAKQPPSPHQVCPEVPQALSDIVMKLMAKTAEERYQSASGLKADLMECLHQWQARGAIAPFAVAQRDVSNKFKLPQKIYGRKEEILMLLTAFERVVHGKSEIMLVEGDSGIGKSSLVEEVHQPIVQKGACFVTCVFDRYQQHIPYGNLIKGFQRLVQQLLAESESNLTFWKERLTAALGSNIRAIAEVIPEIELIFGELPAVEPAFREASLPPAEFQSRFNRIFLSFVRVFCQPRRDASHPGQANSVPQENRPLVLFLDNLQWADAATLKFLELMMRDPNTTSTFIIGTYRGQEVDPIHPLVPQEKRRAEGEREKGGAIFSSTSSPNSPSPPRRGAGSMLVGLRQHVIINELHLIPLPLDPVTQLISDTLHQTVEQVKPLAELVLRKTNGNPFFVREFLKTLHAEGLLGFDEESGSWTWDMPQIEAMDITENVVELMVVKLRKLPANTQEVLPLAACIGNAFNLDLLALIRGKSVEETFTELQEAIREELIVPTSDLEVTNLVCGEEEGETTGAEGAEQCHLLMDRSPLLILNYKFSHSRVQQAAYALIDDVRRRVVHLEIGRLLWNLEFGSRQFDPDSEQSQPINLKSKISPEERAIEIVEHMNLGREFITDDAEKLQLAWLNLIAGRRTKDTSAYGTARKYLQIGINTLPSSSWETAYEVTFSLYKEMAEVEYLNGNFERAAALIWQTLEQARSPLEQAELYNMLVVQYTMTANYAEAIQSGRRALALLGADLPETDPSNTREGSMLEAILQVEIDRAESRLQGRAIADLLDEPVMRDRAQRTIVKVLANIASPVYISNQNLFLYIILKIVNISLTYGNAPESAYGYSSYGVILGSTSGRYHIGYEFGLLAIRLSEKFNQLAEKCKACFVSCHTLNHWVKHIRENDAIDREAYQAGLESGELLFAGYCLIQQLLNQYNQGKNLQQILSNIPKFVQFIQKTKNQIATDAILGFQLPILNLCGLTNSKFYFHNDATNEAEFLESAHSRQSFTTICRYYVLKSQVLYLYGKHEEALKCAEHAERFIAFMLGHFQVVEHNFYYSLILVRHCEELLDSRVQTLDVDRESVDARIQTLQSKLEANQAQLQVWAVSCPENFLHKYLLVQAEMARVSGNDWEAMGLYDRAIASASGNDFTQDEALANELAATFWLSKGKQDFAEIYFKRAYYGYKLWGAKRKVADLQEKYPHLMQRDYLPTAARVQPGSTMHFPNSGRVELDLASAIKASQVIFGERDLDKLLSKFMKILIENAGAQRGFLILDTRGKLSIEAAGVVDSDDVQVLQSIAIDDFGEVKDWLLSPAIVNYVARIKESVVMHDATCDELFPNDPYISQHRPKSILCTPLIHQGKLSGVVYLENNLTTDAFTPNRLEMINLLSAQAAISIENARIYKQQSALTEAYERFVPHEFIQFLNKDSIVEVALGDHVQREMSVLFADIRSFTTLSESLTPEENFRFINSYLSRMEPAILENGGFIDKYIGDAIMALFGGSADDAVVAGITMLKRLVQYNRDRQHIGYRPIQIGIGINTGTLMLGTIGGHSRMDGTVISDAVNLAARLEELTKEYGVPMLISHHTFARLEDPGKYCIRAIERVKVKGKSKYVAVFEVFDGDPAETREGKLATAGLFQEGLLYYHRQLYREAVEQFEQCVRRNPWDRAAQVYLERCYQHLEPTMNSKVLGSAL